MPEPFVVVHPRWPSLEGDVDEAKDMDTEDEDDDTRVDAEEKAMLTNFTKQFEAPLCKKVVCDSTPQSKLVPDFMTNNVRDMFPKNAIIAFCDRKILKDMKLYSEYEVDGTIAIFSEDAHNKQLAKILRLDPSSPTVSTKVKVNP